MLALRELQSGFRAALLHGNADAILPAVRATGVSPSRRVAVYRNNLMHNYCEALRAVYPVVERLVGDAFFAAAARKYIVTHASRSGDLHDYGGEFGVFLDGFEPASALRYLGDVARLEWLWHECFHAAEHSPLPLDRLAGVATDSLDALRMHLHPACRLLASPYPVGKIWAVNQPDWFAPAEVDLASDDAARLLLRRDGFAVVIESLGAGEFGLLRALSRGEPLLGACEQALAAEPDFDLGSVLPGLVERCVLVNFDVLDLQSPE